MNRPCFYWATYFVVCLITVCIASPSVNAEGASDDASHDAAGEHGGHANTNPMSIDPDLAIFTGIVFVMLFLVLLKFAWKPIMEGLAQREEGIARTIEDARRSAEEATAKLKEYEAKLAAAASEAQETIANARKQAEATNERILADGREAAERQQQRAVEEIQSAKEAALSEIAHHSVNSAVALAGRLVQKEIKAEDHDQLIRDAMAKLPSQN